jgi:mRNA-degrading endonuclease RelE of RelBE toxin-antitoxin system
MSYNVKLTPNFKKQAKRLSKKYNSLPSDLAKLFDQLAQNPQMGNPLGKNIYKVRMSITSKGRGKSGGARIITYYQKGEKDILLLTIYNKGMKDSITDKELQNLIDKFV